MKCRHCGAKLNLTFLDLGVAPPSNAYLAADRLRAGEIWYPLRLLVCESCWLVQTEDFVGRESLFDADYAYFSSVSTSWLAHARSYVETMIDRLRLNESSTVVEVASNDGYLLQYVQAAGIPCYGIEPTASTAAAARARGVETIQRFFGTSLARELVVGGRSADLIAANNVLAHVPDINDFVAGFALLLKPGGVATFEFPHLLRMAAENQFDTAYHEHYSYLSLTAVQRIFSANGLTVFDAEELHTHGGSLRVFAQRADAGSQAVMPRVLAILDEEEKAGVTAPSFYAGFQSRAETVKDDFLRFLLAARQRGDKMAAYGAAAKGNTLLNFAGIKPDLLPYVVDRAPSKQGKFLPGSRIPVVGEDRLRADRPDFVVLLPWNLRDEISMQLGYLKEWGGHLVTVVPKLQVLEWP